MHDRRRWLTAATAPAVLAGALLVVGCKERATDAARKPAASAAVAVADNPSTADAQPAGATQPQVAAETQPANSFLTIDGRMTEFPAARLRLSKTAEGVNAQLFSDDPRSATSAEYKGNSFYFELPLQVSDPSDVRQAAYAYKSDDSEPSESPYGIFLGTKYHLQPQDVVIRFDGEGRKIMAQITGRFLVVRATGEQVPGQSATVQGTLYATAEVEQ
jgi:hypothetical protein